MSNSSNIYPDIFKDSRFNVIYFNDLLSAPADTTDALYVVGGSLFFDGVPVGGGGGSLWSLVGGVGPDIYYDAGDVGIGLNSPSYPLEVTGNAKFNTSIILDNTVQLILQDSVGGLTADIKRNVDDTLTIENTTVDKDIYISTAGTGSVVVSQLIANTSISLLESVGATFYTTFSAGNQSADIDYTLPIAQGASDTYLKNDGSGNLSWAAGGGGGTPGGLDTYVQFNDGGSFGGDAGLTYNKTTDVLTILGGIALEETGAGTDLITITASPVAAARSYTIPDILEDGEFVVSPNSVKHAGDAPIWDGTSWINRPMAQYGGFVTYTAPTINGDGTITIGDQTAILWDNATFQGNAAHYTVTGGTTGVAGFPAIPDGVVSYLVADYNSGSPEFQITTTLSDIEQSDTAPYCTLFRTGNLVLTLNWDEMANGLANKLCHRLVKTERFVREYGLMLSENAGNTFAISEGLLWYGVTQDLQAAWDSTVDICRFWYHSGGVWAYSVVTTFNNSQYDDGIDLVALSGNKYTVNWIYKGLADVTNIGGYVLGSTEYSNLAQARLATPPSSLPEAIRSFGILVGRIIVQNGITGAAAVESAFEVRWNPSSVYSHSDLADLTNDDHHQYAFLNGRSGGQILIGGTDANDDLTLYSTSNATKGNIILTDDTIIYSGKKLIFNGV